MRFALKPQVNFVFWRTAFSQAMADYQQKRPRICAGDLPDETANQVCSKSQNLFQNER